MPTTTERQLELGRELAELIVDGPDLEPAALAARHAAGRNAALAYLELERPTLERCICGEHRDCPDGWHSGDDLPCSCTPDCALTEDDQEGTDDVDDEWPDYPCPKDPDGIHHIGCGCDF